MNAHTKLIQDIEEALSKFDDVYTTPNPSGRARYGAAFVPYGAFAPGGPDVLAVVAPHGRLVAIEAKTGSGRQREDQRQCQRRLERVGARYIVARTVADACEAIERVRGGHV